ncbi:hypothetical protein BJ741DRAFT_612318 [Chytriomyces cf. hyalinus JEL632]|nr:hypothetical protein BJ741DRAFT_612318 [Chytriomyces cf. hyalinus JEL632]
MSEFVNGLVNQTFNNAMGSVGSAINGIGNSSVLPSAGGSGNASNFNPGDVIHAITANQGILGAICLGLGCYLLILGFKLFKPTLFIMGFIAGGVLGYTGLMRFRPPEGYQSDANVLLFGSMAVGFVCGGILLCIIQLGIAIVGGVGGLFLALFILGFKNLGLIEDGVNRTIFICVMVVAGVVLAFLLEKHVVIVSSSFVGAYGICFGIDCFAQTGFARASEMFLSSGNSFNITVFQVNPKVIALTVSVVVITLVGILLQYRINSTKRSHKGDK